MKRGLLLSFGGNAKPAGDHCELSAAVSCFHATPRPFPPQVPDLLSSPRSPCALHRQEAQPRYDQPCDEAVVVLDNHGEGGDVPPFTRFWKHSCRGAL